MKPNRYSTPDPRLTPEGLKKLRTEETTRRMQNLSEIAGGAKHWLPDIAQFIGSIPDAAYYVGRRMKNVQGEQSIPSLGWGPAMARAAHQLQQQLGLEEKPNITQGTSVGPIPETTLQEDLGRFANPLQFVNPTSATKTAGRGTAELIARAMQSEGPLARMATSGFRPMNVVKNKGGNWLSGSVEDALGGLKKSRNLSDQTWANLPDSIIEELRSESGAHQLAQQRYPKEWSAAKEAAQPPLDNWIDKALTKYVKNQMATPEDPIRALAEQGVLHYEPPRSPSLIGVARVNRKDAGMRPQATTHLGGSWEDAADAALSPITAGQYQKQVGPNWEANPWMDKLAPEVPVYSVPRGIRELPNLGFNHLIDELSNAINPESGLPRHLLFPADRLDKVSVPQAVQRVSDINKWRAEQKVLADQARANNAATVLHKEYPEKGMRWVQLVNKVGKDRPEGEYVAGIDALRDALKYEGDTMGHCVGGYCDDVVSGQSNIFSLRDAKGQPHVTIETGPQRSWGTDHLEKFRPAAEEEAVGAGLDPDSAAYIGHVQRRMRELAQDSPPVSIVQIKGKGNAKPHDDYLPYVQDFVKSGQWSAVGDLQNTGLRRARDIWNDLEQQKIREAGHDFGEYVSPEEKKAIVESVWPGQWGGYAHGGTVTAPSKIETVGQLRGIIASLSKDLAHG